MYADPGTTEAQALLAAEAATALAGHEALWAWDLGNENSNCTIPPSRESAGAWLARLTSAIRGADAPALVTLGLHMEDVEEDRQLGPREARHRCDLLFDARLHNLCPLGRTGPTDDQLLPFLARMTRWLGDGCDVLFTEFGLPTYRSGDPSGEKAVRESSTVLIEEHAAAAHTARALEALRRAGCLGAMLWC